MSWNLRSRNTRNPRSIIWRTGSGPAATNSSLPTLSAHAAGSRRSTSASARACSAKSSATMTRGSPALTCRPPIASSCESVGCLGTLGRIGLPLVATRAAPVVLVGGKPTLLATIHPQSLDVLADEVLDQLEIVAPFRRGRHQLRFEQLVEPKKRGIARELLLDELRGGFSAFVGKDLIEEGG